MLTDINLRSIYQKIIENINLKIHWQPLEPDKYPIDDTMQCLMKLKEDGKLPSPPQAWSLITSNNTRRRHSGRHSTQIQHARPWDRKGLKSRNAET